MTSKFEGLKETVIEYIDKIRKGEAKLDDLEKAVLEKIEEPKTVVYHPQKGNLSIPRKDVKKYLAEGWYDTPSKFPPERSDILTFEQWEMCDKRLVHEWGLSLASFTEDVMGLNKKKEEDRNSCKEIYEKVIEYYGDEIEKIERNNCEIWKLRDK